MKKLTALIPARGGSKGVPRKNIKNLCGYPLIAYSIAACNQCNLVDRVVVSTDSEEIAEIAMFLGAEVPWLRPARLAADNSTDFDVIEHFFSAEGGDSVAYMRPTTPLRKPERLRQHMKFFFSNREKMSGLRSVHEMPEPPHKSFKIEDGYCKGWFEEYRGIKDYTNLPRQFFPKSYQPNGYIDISKRETIDEYGTAFGTKIMPAITEHVTEIDMEYEFQLLQFQLESEDNSLLKFLQRSNND